MCRVTIWTSSFKKSKEFLLLAGGFLFLFLLFQNDANVRALVVQRSASLKLRSRPMRSIETNMPPKRKPSLILRHLYTPWEDCERWIDNVQTYCRFWIPTEAEYHLNGYQLTCPNREKWEKVPVDPLSFRSLFAEKKIWKDRFYDNNWWIDPICFGKSIPWKLSWYVQSWRAIQR